MSASQGPGRRSEDRVAAFGWPQRGRRSRRNRDRGLRAGCPAPVEQLEPRHALAVTVLSGLSDVTAAATDSSQSISLAGKFDDTAVTGTVVQFNVNTTTPNDRFFVELFDQTGSGRTRTTPLTAANFLSYVDDGSYASTIVHRSLPGFVVQGGGFKAPTAASNQAGGSPTAITAKPAVTNEPGNSNVRGTIALAKLPDNPNSGTNEWFFNLGNNAANLDSQNGGFTAFGRVLGTGMTVVDAMAAVPTYNFGGTFTNLPLRNVPNPVPNPFVIQPEQYVTLPAITRIGELVYTVTSSNTGLVTGSIASVGNVPTLVLTHAPGQSGSASITVRAASVFDATDFKESAFTVTRQPPTAPVAPTGVTGTAGNTEVSLSWTAPASNGGSAITDYVIQYSTNGGTSWTPFSDGTSTATTATVTGLTNGTAYVFRAAAVNSVGTGTFSTASAAVTPLAFAGSPTSVSGTPAVGQVNLSWTAPASTGGSAITDYVIQYSTNGGTSWTPFSDGTSTATTATVTGLTNGTAYGFRVAAVNSAGTGLFSAASASVTPGNVPGLPTGVSGRAGDGRVQVSWTAPASNGSTAITDYVIQFSTNSGTSWTTFSDGTSTATTAMVTGLTNGTSYTFRVSAVNAVGTSAAAATASASIPRPNVFVVGAEIGAGSQPMVQLVDAVTGGMLAQAMVFEATFRGGVRPAMGDVTGDTVPEVVVASGVGRTGEIRVYEQRFTAGKVELVELPAYRTLPFGSGYTGGVEVAVGEVDGNGREDIVAAMSRGGGTVNVFRSVNAVDPVENTPYRTFTPFPGTFNGGASVAVVDVGTFVQGRLTDATAVDNRMEIVVGSGAGMRSTVKVYDVSATPRVVSTMLPFPATFVGGVSVSTGRYDADPLDDVIASAGRGGGGGTSVYSVRLDRPAANLLATWAAFASLARPNAPAFTAAIDLDDDGRLDTLYATQGDAGGSAGVTKFSTVGSRTGSHGSLQGPLRIAAPRPMFRRP